MTRRPSNSYRPSVSRPGTGRMRFGMVAVCVTRDSDPGLNAGKAKVLYQLLVSYADAGSRDTDKGYPYREALADCLDCTKQTVDNATKYLEHEIGLIKVTRRKVDGKPDENDANLYEVYDSWLINGYEPPGNTPPQLVARYGSTIGGFDVEAWMAEHSPGFDLAAWRATHEARRRDQEAKRHEQRRKERQRRKPKKEGGSGISSATREGQKSEGGSGTDSATPGGTDSATGGGMSSARSTAVDLDANDKKSKDRVADAVGKGAGGFARAGAHESAGGETAEALGGCAASATDLPPQRTTSPRPPTVRTKPRRTPAGFDEVRAAIPEDVARQGTQLYPGLHRAINDLLTGAEGIPERTPEQVIARIGRRWFGEHADVRAGSDYRGCDRCTPSGCKAPRRSHENPLGCDRIINRASWLAAAILVQDCPDPSCEDGLMLDGTGECRACVQRAKDRRRDEEAAAAASAQFVLRNPGEPNGTVGSTDMATVDGWSEAALAEEARFQLLLAGRGVFGAMLGYQVREHMTAWKDRHPMPTGEAAEPRLVPPVEPTPEEADYGPDGEEAWNTALQSAEWQAWKAQREAAKAAPF